MNNRYIIKVMHPLLRPGLSIETEASERYVVAVLEKVMELVREFNRREKEKKEKVKGIMTRK